MLTLSALGIFAFLFSLILVPVIRDVFRRWQVIDHPDGERKLHKQPVPRSGGLAIAISYICALLVFVALRPEHNSFLVAHSRFLLKMLPAVAVIVITGLLDDLRGLSVRQKLVGQIIAGSLAYLAGVRMLAVSGSSVEALWSAPLTVLWLVACSNAFNLMDGVDGLAGGLALCSTSALIVGAVLDHNIGLALASLPLAGALLGFLRYNFPPASVFLGDSGSLGVGFIVGCCAVIWTSEAASLTAVSAAGMTVAVPLLDTVISILRRFLGRKPIFGADRGHIHHRLLDLGFGPRGVTLLLCGAATVAAAFAVTQHMLYGRYGVAVLVAFVAAAWIGVCALRYDELATVARLLIGSRLRTVVQSEILLRNFKRAMDRAENVDQCWQTVQDWCHDLGFDEARLCTTVEGTPGGSSYALHDGWLMVVPLWDGLRVDLIRHSGSEVSVESQVADILLSRAANFKPLLSAGVSTNGKAKARPSPSGPVVIIGAGPAGLTAAYELSKDHVPSVVLEKGKIVGGLARTEEYKGYLFDIGGHRFFTKVALVERMWREVLGDDFIKRPRLSRIYYKSKFYSYPLEPKNALRNLGILESIRCVLSYARAQLLPERKEDTFEAWISNRFGRRLFENFFKTYTEKVWGIPCNEISAEWAAQRIRGLSLASVITNALLPKRILAKGKVIKTLIEEFDYPRRGPGMMWVKTKEIIESRNSKVVFEAPVEKIRWEPGRVLSVEAGGQSYVGEHFINSMPLRELIRSFDPPPPGDVRLAAEDFHYRDFLTVVLIVRGSKLFPDNWIYVHDPEVKVGRIQNYNNWSPEMVPDPRYTCLGLEYFCSVGDGTWSLSDQELFELGKREIAALGLVDPSLIEDGTVLRVEKAYPVYDERYRRALATLRLFLSTLTNFQTTGRNGMHRYNNQDHSMLTAILAVRNIMGANYDIWNVNVDAEYHEEGSAITEEEIAAMEASQPRVPRQRPRVSAASALNS